MNDVDSAYRDRARWIALACSTFPSVLVPGADPTCPEWAVVYIDLPTGQVSQHIHPGDLDLFGHVLVGHEVWDGHDTDEKNRRLAAAADLIAKETTDG